MVSFSGREVGGTPKPPTSPFRARKTNRSGVGLARVQARQRRAGLILSFVPTIVLMALGYAIPVASVVVMSLEDDAGAFVGIQNYTDVLTSYYFLDSLWFTLRTAIISTALAMAIAVIVALALRQTFVGKKIVLLMFQFNMTIPRMAAAMMIILLLSQYGLIAQIAHGLGFIDSAAQFPWLIRDTEGLGLIATFTWKFFPYIGMSVLGVLQGASQEYEDQSATLGVGRVKTFFHVTLPMILPATSIASIIVFAAAFGDYEIPQILSGTTHRMLSVYTYQKYTDPAMMDKPESYVLMVMMSLVLIIVIMVYRRLTWERGGPDE